jgi:aerobic carbon-monoxide dehydrogenase medium subunit
MYPSRFSYEAPSTLEEAIALLAASGGEAKILAGGQSLIPMMKLRFAGPRTLIDINNIPGLAYHHADSDGTYRIGALCRHADLEKSTNLADHQPTIAATAPLVADPIVRARGTLVGSVCHADPQGDWASVMVALRGSIVARGPNGRRSIPVADFVAGPFQTVLASDEIAVEAVVPAPTGTRAGGYLKLERRVGDFATAGVAVSLEMTGATVNRAGIGLTGVGASTIDATDAAEALVGATLGPDTTEAAARLAADAAQPRSDHRGSADYKRHIVATFVRRILNQIELAGEKVV